MPIYRITAPNGKTYRIEGPPGASDADVARAVMAQFPESAKAAPPPEEGGFFSNVGNLLVEGGKSALSAAEISPAVISGGVDKGQAETIAKELGRKRVEPKALKEAQAAFADEAADYDKAKGLGVLGPIASMIGEFGKQALTNPEGAVYLMASSAANIAPSIAGMLGGAKVGGMAGTAVAPGVGTAIGTLGGGVAGAFAGSAPLEIGMEFTGRVGQELQRRGLQPTEANVAKLLEDKKFVEQAVSDARTKGSTTAAIDAAFTLGAGRFATAPGRAALRDAAGELGGAADAVQIATRADELLKARTLTQKVGRGAGAVGIDVAGGGLSEAGGQLAAYGEVDLADVGLEMLGELGGSAVEIPAAMRALRDTRVAPVDPGVVPPVDPNLVDIEPEVPVAPVAPAEETEGQAAARRIAEIEEDFPPLTRSTLDPSSPRVEPILAPDREQGQKILDAEAAITAPAGKAKPKLNIEPVASPEAFSSLTRQEFGEPISLIAKDVSGKQLGRLTYMPNGGPIDVFVEEPARRQGVATALYDAFEATGRKLPAEDSGVIISEEARAVRAKRAGAAPIGTRAATVPSSGRVSPFGETKMPARQASIEDEVILQNRDRSTEASIGQMQSIAAKPDYGRMGFSRDLANGAPVVFGGTVEPTRMGVQDVAIATDGRRIPTQYAVVEADEVLASNTVDGSTNDAYATSRDSIRAIAGNGRIAGIQAAYQRGNADNYKTELIADARLHGVDPAAIESMKAPVLVRFMPRESITRDIGDVSNISTGLELSAAEKAKNDLQRVDLDSVEFSDEGNITPTSVMEFIRAMPETERGGLIDNGKPSAQAFDRLRAAVFAKAYKNNELIRIYTQSEDAEIRSIFNALSKVAPKMSRLEGAGDFDIRGIVTSAAELALNARRSGVPIMRAAQQLDMATDPDVYAMLEMFARNSRSAKNVARYLGNLADSAYAESSKPTQDFFGEVPKRSRADLLEQARIEDEQARQAEPLEEQTGRKPSQEDDVQAGNEPRRKEPARQNQGEELELKPATPETFQAAEKRAAQAPKDLEADQIRRESEAGADQFRLEGGEGRQDLTGKLFQQDSGVAGDEIIVDGKVRPIKNSEGRLIENDPQKLRNFWRFFGESKVVDKQGRPLVVYHGTAKDFSEFDVARLGDNTREESGELGFFFTSKNFLSDSYADIASRGGWSGKTEQGSPVVYPVFLSIQNPKRYDTASAFYRDADKYKGRLNEWRAELQSQGHDGVIVRGDFEEVIAFSPNQIKSAIGNEGSYSDQSPNILESKEVGKGWDIDPAEQAMERELVGKSVDEMGQWVVDNAPNQFTKVIAQKVQARIKEMQRRGVNMKIEVLTGDRRPMSMYSARGALSYKFSKGKPADMLLQLNGAAVVNNQAGYPPGMRYITVLHEMLHMATTAQTAGLKADHPLIRELNDIRNKVVEEFNKRVKAGNLSDFEKRIYNRSINALFNTDEVLAWGLTDSDMQKFMASIKVGEKTLFDKFVELMRKTLGLDVSYESAMDRLVKTSDQLLDMSIDEVEAGIQQRGYMFGPAQPRLQPGDTMQGELFSAQQPMSKPPVGKQRLNVFNQTPLSQWTKPDETKMANFVYTMQDKLVDTKDVVKAISDQVGKIEEQWNPYLQEELYHGRTAKQTKDFLSDEMRPLVKMMERMGVTIDELDTYLHNRIAEQRNKQAAALNPNLQDGGSGIMTADARAYLAGLTKEQKAKYEQLAKKVDQISQGTRNLLVDTGLESQETVDSWEAENPNYVPLFREDVDYGVTKEVTTGLGFNTKGGTSKRFMGSQRKVVNILANIAMQRERAIVRSNKNRVAVATYGLAVKNPNPGFWLAVNPDAKNPKKVIDELMAMGLTAADAKGVMKEPVQARIERKKNPKTGLMEEQIVYEVNPAARGKFDVFASRVNGQDRYVFFNGNDPRAARMVTALKNLDADSLGRVMGMAAMITRFFAAINTQYNPIFGAVNFLRDMQGAAIQVSNTPLAGKRADIMAGAFPALKGIYTSLRADTKGKTAPMGQWAKLWDEFQQEGGQTGFRDQFSRSDERAEALEKELKQISENKAKKSVRAIFDWLSDYNDAMENALRLSAYKAGLDKGLSKQEAASVAKNLTVNFNRKGQIGVQANALYAFFNAAVQGTARLLQTLGTVENGKFRLTKVGKTILGGGFLLGSLQALALAAAGFDDDEPPQFIRERNLIIPTFDGKYITIPMPLGYNVIPNTSRIITEFVLSGGKDPAKRVAAITSAFLDMFNPIGNAGWSFQTFAPTIADPMVALTENKDWTGKPIAREDFSNLDPTPGYTRSKETASWFSKNLSEFLNLATGGTSYKPGVFSPTPDQIDYLIGVGFGGVGREALKVEQTITGAFTGEEVPTYKIPLAGRFFGDTKAAASEANKFYTNLKELNQHENEIKGRRKDKGDVAGYIRENPESRLVNAANAVERNVQALRKKRRELVESDAPKEKVQQIEKQITAQMKRLNDMVKKLEK